MSPYGDYFKNKKITVIGLGVLGNPRFSDGLASCFPPRGTALFPYRNCLLVGYFVSFLTKYLNESCEASSIRFSPDPLLQIESLGFIFQYG